MKLGHIVTMISSSSSIMVHIASCFQELWPCVYDMSTFEGCLLSKSNSFDHNFMRLGHIVKYHNVSFKFDNGPYRIMLSGVMSLIL